MEWRLDDPTATLEVSFNEVAPPSREEVGAFLEQVEPVVSDAAIRALVVNGERVAGHGPWTYPDVVGPVLYEAARRRTLFPQGPASGAT